ncbi:MAG: hypothetical protein KTU85_06925 [Acidimicrobiia bacterium]|nr:hypothetical protein [Acidimicrobiia bacterium]MCY4456821.1 hypothetical protein [Acidimicrobiaceae bacterium]
MFETSCCRVINFCVNLFDIRRDRETPLVVHVDEIKDYGVFFRNKRDLTVHHAMAVAISILMSIAFCYVLYGKWF